MPYILHVTKALIKSKRLFFLYWNLNWTSKALFFLVALGSLLLSVKNSCYFDIFLFIRTEFHFIRFFFLPKCNKLFYFFQWLTSKSCLLLLLLLFFPKWFPNPSEQGLSLCTSMVCTPSDGECSSWTQVMRLLSLCKVVHPSCNVSTVWYPGKRCQNGYNYVSLNTSLLDVYSSQKVYLLCLCSCPLLISVAQGAHSSDYI